MNRRDLIKTIGVGGTIPFLASGVGTSQEETFQKGVIYTVSDDGTAAATHPDDDFGETKWENDEFSTFGSIGTNSVDVGPENQQVYFDTSDRSIVALGAQMGEKEWEHDLDSDNDEQASSIRVSPDGQSVYYGSSESVLASLDSGTGEEEWNNTSFSWGSPVGGLEVSPDGERIYAVTSNGDIVGALDSENGELIWEYEHSTRPTEVTTDGDTVYYSDFNGDIFALDTEGNLIWEEETDFSRNARSIEVSPTKEELYIGWNNDRLRAINKDDGSKIWENSDSDDIEYMSVRNDGEIIYLTSEFQVFEIDTDDGSTTNTLGFPHSERVTSVSGEFGADVVLDDRIFYNSKELLTNELEGTQNGTHNTGTK